MRIPIVMFALLFAACGTPAPKPGEPVVATFSIAAFDPETGDLGVAVQSRFLGVGVVVPWVRADVGAVATQALANPAFGPDGLELLDDGVEAKEVVGRLIADDPGRDRRQLGVVDGQGRAAAWTGKRTLGWSGHVTGEHYCCQGNILAGREVVGGMAEAFEAAKGPLAERLVAALAAGQAAGGDKRGRQSAALLVARRGGGYLGANDRYIDLRVDDHPKPIQELERLLTLRRGFGRDAPVPLRLEHVGREPRGPFITHRKAGPRAVWEQWKRLWANEDWQGIHALAGDDYRETHSIDDLEKAHTEPMAAQVRVRRADFLGTQIVAENVAGIRHPRYAKLYFAVPRQRAPVMLLMAREGGAWVIVP